MDVRPLRTKADYQDALKRLETIFDAEANTSEGDELETLAMLISDYESIHFSIDVPDHNNQT